MWSSKVLLVVLLALMSTMKIFFHLILFATCDFYVFSPTCSGFVVYYFGFVKVKKYKSLADLDGDVQLLVDNCHRFFRSTDSQVIILCFLFLFST